MKPRTVYVILEIETDAPLKYLGDKDTWTTKPLSEHEVMANALLSIRGATARVAQPAKEKQKGKAKR